MAQDAQKLITQIFSVKNSFNVQDKNHRISHDLSKRVSLSKVNV